jgi:hypothetical protein
MLLDGRLPEGPLTSESGLGRVKTALGVSALPKDAVYLGCDRSD